MGSGVKRLFPPMLMGEAWANTWCDIHKFLDHEDIGSRSHGIIDYCFWCRRLSIKSLYAVIGESSK